MSFEADVRISNIRTAFIVNINVINTVTVWAVPHIELLLYQNLIIFKLLNLYQFQNPVSQSKFMNIFSTIFVYWKSIVTLCICNKHIWVQEKRPFLMFFYKQYITAKQRMLIFNCLNYMQIVPARCINNFSVTKMWKLFTASKLLRLRLCPTAFKG